jgi:small basic protein
MAKFLVGVLIGVILGLVLAAMFPHTVTDILSYLGVSPAT